MVVGFEPTSNYYSSRSTVELVPFMYIILQTTHDHSARLRRLGSLCYVCGCVMRCSQGINVESCKGWMTRRLSVVYRPGRGETKPNWYITSLPRGNALFLAVSFTYPLPHKKDAPKDACLFP